MIVFLYLGCLNKYMCRLFFFSKSTLHCPKNDDNCCDSSNDGDDDDDDDLGFSIY